MDVQIKAHSKESPTYAYLFGYRSANITDDDVPKWMGTSICKSMIRRMLPCKCMQRFDCLHLCIF